MDEKVVLAGNLVFLGLADIFQLLGGNNCIGKLKITSQHVPTPGLIYFLDGNPINANSGPLQGLDAIFSMFGWVEGKFEFHQEKVEVKRVINNNAMEVVLDALRMIDDGLIKKMGPLSSDKVASMQSGGLKSALPVIRKPILESMDFIEQETFLNGKIIVKEKGYGNWIWIVLAGVVEITKETSNGPITIVQLGEGCCIGNLASFTILEPSRSATATAVGDVKLGVLDTQRLSEEYSSFSPDFQTILQSLDGRLRKITDRAVFLYTKQDKPFKLPKDSKTIIKEGSSMKELFSIKKGNVSLVRSSPAGQLSLITLKRGDVYGYMPFLDTSLEPRCASVIASNDLEVNKLDINSLQKEHDQLSGTFKSLTECVATCVAMTSRLVYFLKMKQSKKKLK